jgi:hypothetical protein
MYDMYPWRSASPAERPPRQATRAVQFSLDRRDNGGDAREPAGGPAGGPGQAAPGPARP